MNSNFKTMRRRVQEYLFYRRSLGFQLHIEGKQLLKFADYVDSKNYCGPVTEMLAIEWAKLSKKSSRLTWARRLEIVTCFAKHCVVTEPDTQIPPKGIFGKSHRRITPHIFCKSEIQQILDATKHLAPKDNLRQTSFHCLFALLYVTGLRISEALNLSSDDVDFGQKLLRIKQTKFYKSRLVPLDSSTITALSNYRKRCDHYAPSSRSNTFFILDNGKPIKLRTAEYAFSKIRCLLGLENPLQGRRPRIYDLRHTFVCHRLLSWYEQGVDVQQMIPYLSTYLGHVKVSDTYWYITGIPELMNIAATLFNSFINKQSIKGKTL